MKSTRTRRAQGARRRALRVALFALACLLAVAGNIFRPAVRPASAAPAQGTKTRVAKRRATQTGAERAQAAKPARRAQALDNVTPASTTCPNKTTISPNATVSGTLANGDCVLQLLDENNQVYSDNTFYDEYTFTADAGQVVSISMSSTTFDTYLFLLKPGETIPHDDPDLTIQNDDGGGGTNSRIPASGIITLPQTGTYSILANVFPTISNPATTGSYTLTLTFGSTGGQICSPNPTPITNGQTINGTLTADDCTLPGDGSSYDAYSFTANAGQQVAITMNSTAFNSYLILLAPDGTSIAEDDGGSSLNARIPPGTGTFAALPQTGTYIVLANANAAGETGAYTINLSISGTNCPSTPINIGQTLNGALASGDCRLPLDGSFIDTYTFTGTAGQRIEITMTSTAFDAYLFLLSPTGSELDADNNGGGGTNARIPSADGNFTGVLPSTGTYTIYANSEAPGQTGSYALTLAQGTAATVQFSTANFTVAENTPGPGAGVIPITSAVITVTRSGDTTGTSTVAYSTVDNTAAVPCDPTFTAERGIAYARCDYATTIDTLTFTPGETSKTFAVPLFNDVHVEGNETFQVRLASPSGAALGTQATATVTLTDDDTVAPTTNPINSSPFFVRMQYLDFLSREPELSGFQAWLNVLNNCSNVNNNPLCDRILVSSSFFLSQEFQLKGTYVYRFYKVAFARQPNYVEFVVDVRNVTGQTANEVFAKKAAFANAFVQRLEFANVYNGQGNAQYVATLLGRYGLTQITTPDPAAPDGSQKVTLTQTELTNRLNAATLTRAQVLRAISDSDQVVAAEFTRAFVAMQYYGYLRRTPEPSGYQAWLNYLTANPTDFRTMVNGFMNSAEYRLRFGPNVP